MNISDLEIGFYVQPVNAVVGYYVCINGFKGDLITFTNWSALTSNEVVGVPITENWMAALKYYQSDEAIDARSYKYSNTEIVFKGEDVLWRQAEGPFKKITYVHEAQRLILDRFGYTKIVELQDGCHINFITNSNEGYAKGMKIRIATPSSTYIISILEEHNQGKGKTMYTIR